MKAKKVDAYNDSTKENRYMDFKEQVSQIKITEVRKPRFYLSWINTENGRDKDERYERVDDSGYVYYINSHNTDDITDKNNSFFKVLEDMYQEAM